ncbi:MAG: sigma 54-interacting transcriptional regulator [Deltaproteobacteria bacterium]|nr:sigma 54-interacting transcriptional regulator [Deltaproteobacteria bacterium]
MRTHAGNDGKAQRIRRKSEWNRTQELDILRLIFDNIYNGVMITDPEGFITHINRPYGQFLGIDPEPQIGKHCTEVVENTRMHIVGKTGDPEINHTQLIKGQKMVVQRIPIRKNGKVIAVFGQVMFKDVRDVTKLARRLSLLESKVELYEKEIISLRSTRHTLDSIIGDSETITSLKREALRAASNHFPVLLTGESGTGKELFAQGIHHASPRRLHPFVRINCAAIPKDLLESELFGYEKGAFTGAKTDGKPGKFELAKNGTAFLDEIGDLPLQMQPKLLRVLEDKEFERVGGTTVLRSNFRLIAATNHNLEEMVSEGGFRKDLFYRLNVIPLHIPPLRDRREDIGPLSRHFLKQMAEENSLPRIEIDAKAEEVLTNYDWPGNIRELTNALYRIASSMDGNTIHPCDLPFHLHRSRKGPLNAEGTPLKNVQTRAEREAIIYALKTTNNNKAKAAEVLGIHRTLLYKKMKKYGISITMAP